jgi:large subunit ribosomal protein L29
MSVKELRAKSGADLQKELLGLRREQFNLRMARATGQTAKPDQFSKVRRNIARLKTVMAEQRTASAGTAAPVQKSPLTKAKGKRA